MISLTFRFVIILSSAHALLTRWPIVIDVYNFINKPMFLHDACFQLTLILSSVIVSLGDKKARMHFKVIYFPFGNYKMR